MDVKPGYQQTEVGMIPKDWEVVPMGSLGVFSKGQGIRKDEAASGEIPCVRYGEIYTYHDDIIRSFNSSISTEVAKSSKRIKRGDILFAGSGETKKEIGKCVAFIGNDEVYAGGDIVILSVNNGDPSYLGYLLNDPMIGRQKASKGQGDAVVHISSVALSSIQVPLPPTKAEQKAIAEALNDADALIESLEQLLNKKRQIKQGAMQELLTGKKRLPGFENGSLLKPTEIGTLPTDWLVRPLLSLIDAGRSIRYGIVQPGKYDSNGRFMIRGQDYSEAKGWANQSDVFRVGDKIEQRYRNARVKTGDLIMTIVGYCGHVETVPDWLDGANLTQTTARIAIQPDKAIAAYCKYVLQSDTGKKQVAVYIKGAAQPGLNCGDVEQFILGLPPTLDEQNAIATVLSNIDAEITGLEKKLVKSHQIKHGMMQKLLTGKIRLI